MGSHRSQCHANTHLKDSGIWSFATRLPLREGLGHVIAAFPYSGVVDVSNGSRLIRRIFTWR